MPVSERDRSRLSALLATLRPAHSLAARVERLSADHREIYEHYHDRMSAFIKRNDTDEDGHKGNAYATILCGYGPQLPDDISVALIGEIPHILTTDDENTAMQKYQQWMRT